MHFYKRLITSKLEVQRVVQNAIYLSELPLCACRASLSVLH